MTTRTYESVLKDIEENPDNHCHDFGELSLCCLIDGVFEPSLMDAHQELFGSNGGQRCDVALGPCACGAWHTKDEWPIRMAKSKLSKVHD
ncbi:MAG: hypothetical protein V1738_03190 [Patescibacteria group bacterium]